jgi:S-methylmethionine-dependent homocysteine/selenocysteine methylase
MTTLPQLDDRLFLTDGGIETALIFQDGVDLPYFAAFDLLKDETGIEHLRRYFRRYASIARENGTGFILESPTWRASPDWAAKLGYSADRLDSSNRRSIDLMRELQREHETSASPMVVSGCIGPRGDGYDPGTVMTAEEAQAYHAGQVASFKLAGADMITAITMTNIPEAIGVTRAARSQGLPVAISFTTETDGRLPTGETLHQAIEAVDAATLDGPSYYMINCAHPTHFVSRLKDAGPWSKRIRGIRANASKLSHNELDESETLDDGDPTELASDYVAIRRLQGQVSVLGGCCGTDHRHIQQIYEACSRG